MKFIPTNVVGVMILDIEPHLDDRGFFARTWCQREGEANGLEFETLQCNVSFNLRKGTLRGMHYQIAPFDEVKLVRCTSGALLDVTIDIRPNSRSFARYAAVELTAENRRALYIPKGCAHGFLTLADDTEVFYQMSAVYSAEHSRGFRWDDPFFGVSWPTPIEVISERDRSYPAFVAASTIHTSR